ncbi:hypothetical protein PNBC_12275 [Paenibacillus crassostreae]|uniref:Uncharacterized protein n=2 Tax=Paenibacillus crassostreae TaxID=1763538 RepID=A0A167DUR3_9BACL|nr:hypothetical protein LPB68_01680 [Paenibacillus crassostreae]OAB74800.1 hypothetical protein PNBC_12275 [Paenibacillus crassostreae]
MRRYWFSILLSVFMIVGLGTYYVYGATDHLPQYKLATIEGDVNEGAQIQVLGSYIGGRGSEILSVTTDGSDYESSQSIYSKMFSNSSRTWIAEQPGTREMIKDHRSFMWGKGNGNSFYKDEEWIIYAEAVNNPDATKPELLLKIDLLNQTSGEVKHYDTIVGEMPYVFSYVVDVQFFEDKIHILTFNNHPWSEVDITDSNQYHDYIVDVNTGTLTDQEILNYGISTKDNVELNYNIITNADLTTQSDVAVFVVSEETRAPMKNDEYNRVLLDKHFYSYTYQTGELIDLSSLLSTVKMGVNTSYRLDGSILSILNYESDGLTVSRFNLVTEKLDKDVISITTQLLSGDTIATGIMSNDKLNILYHHNDNPMVAVINLANGVIVYKGEVVLDGAGSENTDHMKNVELYSLAIVE